jgi:hypothetical protein
MALKTETNGQFIGCQLKVGRFLQRDKILEELAGFRRPIWPVAASRELSAEGGTVLQPAGPQPVKVCLADLEASGRFCAVNVSGIKLLQDVLEKGAGEAFGQ